MAQWNTLEKDKVRGGSEGNETWWNERKKENKKGGKDDERGIKK
jgi:hypothetical protein